MTAKDYVVLNVFELHSDDCLVVSDSRGTRNVQEGDELYLDDEIISGKLETYTVESLDYLSPIMLEENDEVLVVVNSLGIIIPKEISDGLLANDIRNFSNYSPDNN